MKTDRAEISKTVLRAIRLSFPQADNIVVKDIRTVKTAMTWKSVVLKARCSLTGLDPVKKPGPGEAADRAVAAPSGDPV